MTIILHMNSIAVLFVIFVLFGLFVVFSNPVFAACVRLYDASFHWPDVPCIDIPLTEDEQKKLWAPYYYYQGHEWMAQKAAELEELRKSHPSEDDLFNKFVGDDTDYIPQNHYFWQYYELLGNTSPSAGPESVDIPKSQKACDESCTDRIESSVTSYVCSEINSSLGKYTCANKSYLTTTVLLTSADETGKQMTFRPTNVVLSLGINNTILWHNTNTMTTISNEEKAFESIQIPFNDIRFQILDRAGKYTFYDESNPDVKVNVVVVPLDKNFKAGNPIPRFTYFSDIRFQTFRTGMDQQNFVHGISIIDSETLSVTLDNTMDPQYAVNENPERTETVIMSVGDTILSGCTFHYDTYSRMFYHMLKAINEDENTAEFMETLDYAPENACDPLYSDPSNLLKFLSHPKTGNNTEAPSHGNLPGTMNSDTYKIFDKPPLKQFKSGIPASEIQCKEELELALKSSDDSPICVMPETKEKLIQRGWAKPV